MGKSNLSIEKKKKPTAPISKAKKAARAQLEAGAAASAKDAAVWRAKIEKQERDMAPLRRGLKELHEKKQKALKEQAKERAMRKKLKLKPKEGSGPTKLA